MALTDKLTAIGDAIRSKTETEDSLTLDQIAAKIGEMSFGDIKIKTYTTVVQTTFTEFSVRIEGFPCAIVFPGCKTADVNTISKNAKYHTNVWIFPKEDFTKEDILNYSINREGSGKIKPTDSAISITYNNGKITISSSKEIKCFNEAVWSFSPIIVKNQGE